MWLLGVAKLGRDIENAGGKYSTAVNASVTHLVVTAKAFASNSSKGEFTLFQRYLLRLRICFSLSLLLEFYMFVAETILYYFLSYLPPQSLYLLLLSNFARKYM